MDGVTILKRQCPRCGIRRTVRIGRTRQLLCFNCRFRWVQFQPKVGGL